MAKILGGFGLLAGATYPFRVLGVFIRYPRLWGYMLIPILVNCLVAILLYAGLLFFGFETLENLSNGLTIWLDNWISNLPPWLELIEYLFIALEWLLRVLITIVFLILTGFILTQFGVLLGAPWYGQLSEQLEKIRTGNLEIVEVSIVEDLWRAILFELKKLQLSAFVGFFLLLLNFLPGIGTLIASIGGFTLTLTLICLDFLDSPLERRRLPFKRKLKIVYRSLPASGSFSVACLALISIPLVNLVTIPICVASGTLFFCDRVLPQLSPSRR